MIHLLLKPGLENFEHHFASMWDECNCVVVWAIFGIAFLRDWMKADLFQPCGSWWVFQICWHIECSTFTASSFRIWNSSTGIPTPPLVLFIVMLPKAHLTSHSKMSGSRWVITALWLSGPPSLSSRGRPFLPGGCAPQTWATWAVCTWASPMCITIKRCCSARSPQSTLAWPGDLHSGHEPHPGSHHGWPHENELSPMTELSGIQVQPSWDVKWNIWVQRVEE